ncbi:hypothetical protein [Nocardia sp. 348MFTsu5.1]|uniref:hypothetical protein n=1 Tax=Nocardia sp. 348MFTsu5.1 TaxID=1172185 RepID=UPI00039C6723|nr:hypothetical protein [Nocardia sp. 348MFTsu5.1]
MTNRYKVLRFNQYGSDTDADELYMFAAPATELARWAGIPRKGWRVRLLYQRWVTPGRSREVTEFWDRAGEIRGPHGKYLLGPTALTLASASELDITDEGIMLSYSPPFSTADSEYEQLAKVANIALISIVPRLTEVEVQKLQDVRENLAFVPDEYEPNHVLQSAIQISQIAYDPEAFCTRNEVSISERGELIEALEALCRPALVVDGQHRLLGAAQSKHAVSLPVVLIPKAGWIDQIYQFVVVNEKAQRVKTDLLTDIFGNSLTPGEQGIVRDWLEQSNVEVEPRIAAVIAGKHPESPFLGMVKLQLGGEIGTQGFVTEITIRQLIEGGRGSTPGWRTDPDFLMYYIRPTIQDSAAWESWNSGYWREFWFAFWDEVGKFYNQQSDSGLLWGSVQTNLTKSVTLRLMQELFINISIEGAKGALAAADSLRAALKDRLSESEIENVVLDEIKKRSLPSDVDVFRTKVREEFLADGVPVRVFEKPWVTSLDDQAGIDNLRQELRKAYETSKRHERYRAQNKEIFAVEDRA